MFLGCCGLRAGNAAAAAKRRKHMHKRKTSFEQDNPLPPQTPEAAAKAATATATSEELSPQAAMERKLAEVAERNAKLKRDNQRLEEEIANLSFVRFDA